MSGNTWEITDENGVIYSGDEDEMREIFSRAQETIYDEEPFLSWVGDLRLIEVHYLIR